MSASSSTPTASDERTTVKAILLALAATTALDHSAVDATAPEDGAVLAQAPPHIVLTFARHIRLTRDRMIHDAGEAIDLDLDDQTAFATRFELPLEDRGGGLYRIEWRDVSGDGYPMHKTFSFRML